MTKAPVKTGEKQAKARKIGSNRGKAPEPRERTAREQREYDRHKERSRQRLLRPTSKIERVEKDGKTNTVISIADGEDAELYGLQMFEAFGTTSGPFLDDTLDNIARVMSPSRNISETQHNAAMAFMAAVEPENELEATLAAQMIQANECANRCMRAMAGSEWVDQHKMYGDLANKFMRTFTAQVEALAKLRRKGEQVVKYIHVHEGGQAVVAGTINQQRGLQNVRSEEQPFGAGSAEECPAMLGYDAAGNGVPIPGHAERKVPTPRRPESRAA